VDLHEKLAKLYRGFDQWEDALTEYRVLSGLEPEQADHWARLAESLRRLGRESEAKEAAKRAVALDENSPAQSILRD
jgi:tetratricopeptide (TPR) repeat protein